MSVALRQSFRRGLRAVFVNPGAIPIVFFLTLHGCSNNDANQEAGVKTAESGGVSPLCEASCEVGACGDDGCGGTCGCPRREYCNIDQVCVGSRACQDTCEEAGFECGRICKNDCGTCATGECIWGRCVDVPTHVSCADCQLTLSVIEQDGAKLKLAIDFASDTGALPRMADLRIYTNHNAVTALGAVAGDALVKAGKQLYVDTTTGSSLREVDVRTAGLLALSLSNADLIEQGRLAVVTFDLGDIASGTPVAFRVEKRVKTFAPAAADLAMQSDPYDWPVVVER